MLKHCHSSYSETISSITGRKLYFNASAKFCVSPRFSQDGLLAACREWNDYVTGLVNRNKMKRSGGSVGYPHTTRSLVEACFLSREAQDFAMALDALVDHLQEVEARAKSSAMQGKKKMGRRSGQASRVVECLALLWKHELVLFPASELWATRLVPPLTVPPSDNRFYGGLAPVISDMLARLRWTGQRRALRLLPFMIHGILEVGDIGPEIITALEPFSPKPPGNSVYGLCEQLLAAQKRFYAKKAARLEKIPQSYRAFFRPLLAPRADPDFRWAIGKDDERVNQWRDRLSTYLGTITNRVGLRYEVVHLNVLLDYVIENKDIPPSPLLYCCRDYEPRQTFPDYVKVATKKNDRNVSATLMATSHFFSWLLESDGLDEDGVPFREYINPIDPEEIPTQSGSSGQTHRTAIPVRFLRMMREIIESPDENGNPTFAWPKTIAADYFDWVDPQTGETQRIWSPVRSHLFLLRLMLPIRSLQARLLDSGEADSVEYRPSQGGWVRNTGRHATTRRNRKKSNGLLKRIWDHDAGSWFNGLYITTNKTQDREELFMENGYDIPWENQDIIDLFCRVRDWQEVYNPCLRPLSRADLASDPKLLVSRDVAKRLDKLCFLFRDAASPSYPQEPPTDGRLQLFWRFLVAELERRLEAQGITNNDGSKIVLITKTKRGGYPSGTIFDPHSLRVAGLTALAGAGVPIHILSQFVAGHATVLMTIYYNKPSAGKITASLREAWEKLSETESLDWAAYLKGMQFELVHELLIRLG